MADDGGLGTSTLRPASTERSALSALLVLVVLPVVVAGVRVSRSGWTPTLDDGFLVTRAFDVLSVRFPLIGQYSLAGEAGGTPAHSLGPVPYWFLAGPLRLLPTWTLPLWMTVLNGACLAAVVWLAHRRAGLGFAAATAAGVLLAERALGPAVFTAVWNPWAGLAPLLLLAFLAWSIAEGDRWLLPAAVLAASYSMQSHLTYVFPSLALLAVACAVPGMAAVVTWRRGRIGPPPASDGGGRPVRPRWQAPLALAVLVGVLCWAPPAVQQVRDDPGNLELVADAGGSDRATAGSEAASAALGRTLGVPPTFARPVTGSTEAIGEGLEAGPAPGLVVGAAVLVALAAVAGLAVRRGDRLVWTGALVAAALVAAMVLVAWSMPVERVLAVAYSFRWFAFVGIVTWLVVGLGVGRALGRAGRVPAAPSWGAAALVVVVALVAVLPLATTGAFDRWSYAPADRLGDELVAATGPGGTYLLANDGPFVVAFVPALAWRLREAGRNPVLLGDAADAFGDDYAPSGRSCEGIVVLLAGDAPVPAGGRALVTVEVLDAPDSLPTRATLVLTPDPAESC